MNEKEIKRLKKFAKGKISVLDVDATKAERTAGDIIDAVMFSFEMGKLGGQEG